MILVFGGAYQGKLAYVLERFELTEKDVLFCEDSDTSVPSGKKAINSLENWVLALVKEDLDIGALTKMLLEQCKDSIVICSDISGGVVPVDPRMRKWREAVGQVMGALAREADEVIRLFCGIPTRLK